MSWISLSFEREDNLQSPTKKHKTTNEGCSSIHNHYEFISCSWLDKHKPKEINELVVHKNKIRELHDWLLQSKTNKILVICGPSGCGKTATLETVCKKLGFRILEWITPLDKLEACDSQLLFDIKRSPARCFEDFLIRSTRYGSCLDSSTSKTIVLVKDFPNIFLLQPSIFHEVLENVSKKRMNNPIVFICGENSLYRKLFSSKTAFGVSVIRFNSITNLQMLKLLKSIVHKEKHNNINILCDKALSNISALSKGDVRNAVSELYFRSVKTSDKGSPSQPGTPEKSKDSHIDFFNGIGKVFSPKKIAAKDSSVGFKFTTSPETIVEQFLGESRDFIYRLCDNLCTNFTNVYDMSNAAQRLATSDMLLSRWQDKDIFHEYALSVAVWGTMVSNTSPQEPTFKFYGKQDSYHIDKKVKQLYLEGKSLFPDLCGLNYDCLCDTLPYAKYLLANLNTPQKNYLKKTFYLN